MDTPQEEKKKRRLEESTREEAEEALAAEVAHNELANIATGSGSDGGSGSNSASAHPAGVGNPLANLVLAPQHHLNELSRAQCPKCSRKRKYFCYDCFIPMGDPALTPRMRLPLQVDVIHHPTESPSKSTAMHARILAPDDVRIHEFPNFPEYNPDEVLLLFPSPNAVTVSEIDVSRVKKVIFIDSQWQKTARMLRDDRITRLKCVKIDAYRTLFWRYQHHGDEFLATIEAIYYFFKEYHEKRVGSYEGQFDNLLYYYTYFYNLIQDNYKQSGKNFVHKDNYIQNQ